MLYIIAIFLGVVLIIMSARRYHGGSDSKLWTNTEGEILRTIDRRERYNSANEGMRMNHLQVIYKYVVDGKEFENDRVRFKWNHQSIIEETERWSPGKKVTVYFDSENPGDAVLERGLDATNYTSMIAGVFFVIVGIGLQIAESLKMI